MVITLTVLKVYQIVEYLGRSHNITAEGLFRDVKFNLILDAQYIYIYIFTYSLWKTPFRIL